MNEVQFKQNQSSISQHHIFWEAKRSILQKWKLTLDHTVPSHQHLPFPIVHVKLKIKKYHTFVTTSHSLQNCQTIMLVRVLQTQENITIKDWFYFCNCISSSTILYLNSRSTLQNCNLNHWCFGFARSSCAKIIISHHLCYRQANQIQGKMSYQQEEKHTHSLVNKHGT